MQPIINSLLDPVVNFGKVTVSTGYGSLDPVIVLIEGDGSKLPDTALGSFNLIWFNNSTYSDPADDPNVEIVRCTIRTGDILTIDRHQEGTPASNKNASGKIYKMLLSPTKKTIDDIQTESQSNVNTHSILSTGIHGVTGNVVGTSDVQELTNKTLTAPTIDDFTNGNHTHTADNTGGIVDHLNLASIGTNSHAAIDTHIAATGTSVHDLGSMSTQPSDAVSITGGTITGTMVKTTLGLQLPVGLNKWVT